MREPSRGRKDTQKHSGLSLAAAGCVETDMTASQAIGAFDTSGQVQAAQQQPSGALLTFPKQDSKPVCNKKVNLKSQWNHEVTSGRIPGKFPQAGQNLFSCLTRDVLGRRGKSLWWLCPTLEPNGTRDEPLKLQNFSFRRPCCFHDLHLDGPRRQRCPTDMADLQAPSALNVSSPPRWPSLLH